MSALRFKAQTTEAVTGDTFNAFSPLSALRARTYAGNASYAPHASPVTRTREEMRGVMSKMRGVEA
jgi:hypothetical protein